MGMPTCRFSSSSFDLKKNQKDLKQPNPKPNNYDIIRSIVINEYLVIEIKYPDCINFEGKKIMVYRCELKDLVKQKLIDPHFSESKKYYSPIARFEPTNEGWDNACLFVTCLD